jgi:hypothetical protein
MLKLFAFSLDSCIVNKGGGGGCACFGHLGAFGRCSNWFGQVLKSLVQGRSLGAV